MHGFGTDSSNPLVCRNIDYDAVHTVHPQLVRAVAGIPAVQCVPDTDAADGSFCGTVSKAVVQRQHGNVRLLRAAGILCH